MLKGNVFNMLPFLMQKGGEEVERITLTEINATILFITAFLSGIAIIYGYIKKWLKLAIKTEIVDIYKRIETLEKESTRNKTENSILLRGELACLKGLKEQGCNGSVTQSIKEIEDYLLEQVRR